MSAVEFNPARLTLARRRRGLTKTKLAGLLGVEVRSITGYESDEFKPDRDRLMQLAEKLHFPVQFFFGDDSPMCELSRMWWTTAIRVGRL